MVLLFLLLFQALLELDHHVIFHELQEPVHLPSRGRRQDAGLEAVRSDRVESWALEEDVVRPFRGSSTEAACADCAIPHRKFWSRRKTYTYSTCPTE